MIIRLLTFISNNQLKQADTNSKKTDYELNELNENSILLHNYPFSITKGCYLVIEKEYGVPISEDTHKMVQETIAICQVLFIIIVDNHEKTTLQILKLQSQQNLSRVLIPSIQKLFPNWVFEFLFEI